MYGFDISFGKAISIALSIIILLFASPSMPSAGIAGLSILFMQFGMPLELIGAITALISIEDMFETPANCLGNIASTLGSVTSHEYIFVLW